MIHNQTHRSVLYDSLSLQEFLAPANAHYSILSLLSNPQYRRNRLPHLRKRILQSHHFVRLSKAVLQAGISNVRVVCFSGIHLETEPQAYKQPLSART